ncbi:MAG TPA: hypothetical protein VGP36_04080 [Mycobacteriales bacterium]|nr:hypothetical protein [Mycobacteriales bacterium]
MTVFIAVLGAAPGVGKSTLCSGLAAALPGRVDHFREEEILTRPAYAEVAAEFRAGGEVRPSTLLAATSAFVGRCDGDFVVTDALFPYLPSLRAWGHSPAALGSFLAALAEIVRPVVLYLDEDPLVALPRAAAREDPTWLDWYLDKLGVPDVASAASHLCAERDLTLDLLSSWDLHVLPPADPVVLLRAATEIVTG